MAQRAWIEQTSSVLETEAQPLDHRCVKEKFSESARFELADPFKGIDSLAMSSFKPDSRSSPCFWRKVRASLPRGFLGPTAFRVRRNKLDSANLPVVVPERVERPSSDPESEVIYFRYTKGQ